MAGELAAARGVLAAPAAPWPDDHLSQLQPLIGNLERLAAALAGPSAPERADLPRQLAAVLDEAAGLARSLGAEHARPQAALRRVGAKRRPSALAQANRLSGPRPGWARSTMGGSSRPAVFLGLIAFRS